MKIQYDREADVLSILLSETPVEESDEDKPGVILDYDKAWYLVGVGILDAAKHIGNPMSAEYPTPLLVERVREALGRSAFSLALSRSASTAPASFLRRSSDCLEALPQPLNGHERRSVRRFG